MAIVVSGSIAKYVKCESCGHTYSYVMQRTAREAVQGFTLNRQQAKDRAQAVANHKLQLALAHEFDLVACPNCGAFTRTMSAKPRQLFLACVVAFIISGVLFSFAYLRAKYAGRVNLTAVGLGIASLVFAIWALGASWKAMFLLRMDKRRKPGG